MGYYDGVCDECGKNATLVTSMSALCFDCYDEVNPPEEPESDKFDADDVREEWYWQTD